MCYVSCTHNSLLTIVPTLHITCMYILPLIIYIKQQGIRLLIYSVVLGNLNNRNYREIFLILKNIKSIR